MTVEDRRYNSRGARDWAHMSTLVMRSSGRNRKIVSVRSVISVVNQQNSDRAAGLRRAAKVITIVSWIRSLRSRAVEQEVWTQ